MSAEVLLLASAPGRLVGDLLRSVFLIRAAPVLGDREDCVARLFRQAAIFLNTSAPRYFVVVLLAVVARRLTPTWLEFCHSGSEADHDFPPTGWCVFPELPELPVAVFRC